MYRVEHIMGMPIIVDVRDPEVDPDALERAFEWFRFVDATFSTYKSGSDISRLNRGELALEDAHPDVAAVLARCAELREETYGYFDVRSARLAPGGRAASHAGFPGAFDPSGLVKGWSVDRAALILDAAGAHNYSINAGGDIRVCGRPAPAPAWRIGIQHPLLRDKLAAVVVATDLAIATSGAYERGEHIVDPHTGRSPAGVLSVTVTGPDLATADAYATAAYAMGRAGPAWTARLAGYEAMAILADHTVLSTPAFPAA
jgi:thiamine biosynthesis lipoprotein